MDFLILHHPYMGEVAFEALLGRQFLRVAVVAFGNGIRDDLMHLACCRISTQGVYKGLEAEPLEKNRYLIHWSCFKDNRSFGMLIQILAFPRSTVKPLSRVHNADFTSGLKFIRVLHLPPKRLMYFFRSRTLQWDHLLVLSPGRLPSS